VKSWIPENLNGVSIEATGTNMEIDETWDAIDEIDLDKLG